MHFLRYCFVSPKFLGENRAILGPAVLFPRFVIVEVPTVPTSRQIAAAAHDLKPLAIPVPRAYRHDNAVVMTAMMTSVTHNSSSLLDSCVKRKNSCPLLANSSEPSKPFSL